MFDVAALTKTIKAVHYLNPEEVLLLDDDFVIYNLRQRFIGSFDERFQQSRRFFSAVSPDQRMQAQAIARGLQKILVRILLQFQLELERVLERELGRELERELERVRERMLERVRERERARERVLAPVAIPVALKNKFSGQTTYVAYCKRTEHIALADQKGRIELLNLAGGVIHIIEQAASPVLAMAFSPEGDRLAVATESHAIYLWNLKAQPKPTCMATLPTLQWSIQTLLFAQFESGDLELHAGACKGSQLQSSVFRLVLNQKKEKVWRLVSAWNKDFAPSWQGLTVDKSHGLTQNQFKFLTTQGAFGKPAAFFHVNTEQNDQEEHDDLKKLKKLLDRIFVTRKLQQELSLFDPTIPVGLDNWVIVLFRCSQFKSSNAGQSSGAAFFKSSSQSNSNSTHHVYGLLEGLNPSGQRVFIRIDLIGPDKPTDYARVKNKCNEAASSILEDTKKAFIALFEDGRSGMPQEITYQVAGAISREQLKTLFNTLLHDQERQYTPEKNWPQTRIRYKLLGGDEGEGAQNSGHNCLTWLRWRLSEIPKALKLPQNWTDRFYVDPTRALPRQSSGFDASRTVQTINLTSWLAAPAERAGLRH